ncbi:P-loop NTPase [Acidobacteriota bacterium]
MQLEKNSNDSCSFGQCGTDKTHGDRNAKKKEDEKRLRSRLALIRNKILILSGKGGVGKSTVAVNLAVHLSRAGHQVGLLDIDIHGPSIPKLLGLEGQQLYPGEGNTILPVTHKERLKVMSIGFLLSGPSEAVIVRGPMKHSAIKQFLTDVEWGKLDYLIIDAPPGTGDEPLSVVQLLDKPKSAVIVTTPQDLAILDVMKSINFCKQLDVPVIGVIENMSGFICPHCGKTVNIFKEGAGAKMAERMGVPFLSKIPVDPKISEACDDGEPFVTQLSESPALDAFKDIAGPIESLNAPDEKTEEGLSSLNKVFEGKRQG